MACLTLFLASLSFPEHSKIRTERNVNLPERWLKRMQDYDLVIVDCAPTESVLTDAAYFASRYIIVPIKPEFMATIGLPLLAFRSLKEFQRKNKEHRIEIAGLAFNHSSSYSAGPEGQQSIEDVTTEATKHGWHIFENQFGIRRRTRNQRARGRPCPGPATLVATSFRASAASRTKYLIRLDSQRCRHEGRTA